MADNQSKYGQNRNLWRRLYPIGSGRLVPVNITLTDESTNTTYTLDLQKTIRHRDFFQITQFTSGSEIAVPPITYSLGQYDEGLIHFNNDFSAVQNFNFTFTDTPFVVFTVETAARTNHENINVFGLAKSATGFTVGLSAPYSGTVRYRAAYSPTYPATFTSSFTSSITASAGTVDIVHEAIYTASFDALPTFVGTFLKTPFNTSTSGQSDVYLSVTTNNLATASMSGDISAPYSGAIDFIAYT